MARKKSNGARGAQGFLDKVKKPFQRALAWVRAPRERRQTLSKSRASDWRRIAELGDMGTRLDALSAPYYVVRWVAAPGRRRPILREQRFTNAVAALSRGPWTNAAWNALRESTIAVQGKEKVFRRPESTEALTEHDDDFSALFRLLDEEAA